MDLTVEIQRDSLSKLSQNVSIHILNQMTILKWCYMYSCPSLQNASALDLSSLSSHQSLQSSFLQWALPSNLNQPVPLMSFSPPITLPFPCSPPQGAYVYGHIAHTLKLLRQKHMNFCYIYLGQLALFWKGYISYRWKDIIDS